ncbi:hypothetical protein CROQUDRAFT_96132 [Cronartium quercuum f. sp. fusiforme G11]|uniref:Uncharacterized protein n=1 Tax=Cronartium quercuum f. sp. fusiforme G11 TaxID=708437 RepID=A0A9P6NG69_9BASI|nr:hypothetical protein CROQUDRAFT_96132 [Cronartium quercuum f. sp. fusiforme G11]
MGSTPSTYCTSLQSILRVMKQTRKAETPLIFTSWGATSGFSQARDVGEATSIGTRIETSPGVKASTDSPVEQPSIGAKLKVTLTNRINNWMEILRESTNAWLLSIPAIYSDWNLAYVQYERVILQIIDDPPIFKSWHTQGGLVDLIWELVFRRSQLTNEFAGYAKDVAYYIMSTKLPEILAALEIAASSRLKDMVQRSEIEPHNRNQIQVEFAVLKQFLEVEGKDLMCSHRIGPSGSDIEKLNELFPDSDSMEIIRPSRASIPPFRTSVLTWARRPSDSRYFNYVTKLAELIQPLEAAEPDTTKVLTPHELTLPEFKILEDINVHRGMLIREITDNLSSRWKVLTDLELSLAALVIESISEPTSHQAMKILRDVVTHEKYSQYVKDCFDIAIGYNIQSKPPPPVFFEDFVRLVPVAQEIAQARPPYPFEFEHPNYLLSELQTSSFDGPLKNLANLEEWAKKAAIHRVETEEFSGMYHLKAD